MGNLNENSPTPPPIEATVLDAEGRVLYEPEGARERRQESSDRFGTAHEQSKAESPFGPGVRVKTIQVKKMGLLPKIFFGGLFGVLLFVGLAAAGIFLGVFLVGLLAKMTFSPARRRR